MAIMRGVTAFEWVGAQGAHASICSVTFMEPSSLAIPEALRPAPEWRLDGASSRTSDGDDLANLSGGAVCASARDIDGMRGR